MIKSDRELEVTEYILNGLKERYDKKSWPSEPEWKGKAIKESLESIINELEKDIDEYKTKTSV